MLIQGPNGVPVEVPDTVATGLIASGQARPVEPKPKRTRAKSGE